MPPNAPFSAATHLRISMSARPARLGLLVPSEVEGIAWPVMFESALAAQSRFWGGAGNLVLPLSADFTEHEVFWRLCEVFDPDAFVSYAPTLAEMELVEPSFFTRKITDLKGQLADLGDVDSTASRRFIADSLDHSVLELQPRQDQRELIEGRLAPFRTRFGDGRIDHFNASSSVGWPFADALEFEQLPTAIGNPILPGAGAARRLLLTALLGRIPAAVAAKMEERGIAVTDQEVVAAVWSDYIRDRRPQTLQTPWSLGEIGLGYFHMGASVETPAAVVVGDSPWDFALFYALRRLTGRAWWLPSWLARDDGYMATLSRAIRSDAAPEGRDVAIVSTSSIKRRDEVCRRFETLSLERRPDVADWREMFPEEPFRLSVIDSEGRQKSVQTFDGEVLELDTPIPRVPSTDPEVHLRWIAEVSGIDWTPIRHPRLGARLMPEIAADSGFVRTSGHGASYYAMGALILGGTTLEGSVRRPSLRPLSLEKQLQAILESDGWSCQASDKGIYARESMELFGGFEGLCAALRDPAVRPVLDIYRDAKSPAPKLSEDNRRYPTWRHFEELLGTALAPKTVHPLLDAGALTQGIVLRCARCRQKAWHRSGMVTDSFTCERCDLHQPANREAWFGTDEPILSYRLAEVVFQLLENNGELPLLAVLDEFRDSRRTAGQGFELDITPPGEKLREVDIFHSDGNRLWIGEASISGVFKPEKLTFLARLAGTLNAAGVLLVTSQASWPESTLTDARSAFPDFWPQLRMRTGVKTGPAQNDNGET